MIEADAVRGLEKLAAQGFLAVSLFPDARWYAARTTSTSAYWNFSMVRIVAPRGMVIVEHRSSMDLPERLERLYVQRFSSRETPH